MTTHGMSRTREYMVWKAMIRRCTKRTAKDYPRYGGRGITVCPRWVRDFEAFVADVGCRPSDAHTLERIDNAVGYTADNCRWATITEQANNKRTTHFVEYRGARMSIADAARVAGNLVLRETARNRIWRGWSVERALETPNQFRRDPSTRKVIREAQP